MVGPAHALVAQLSPALGRLEGLVSAHVFGSVARGHTHRESDVDIAVLLDRAVYPTAADRFAVRLRLMADLQRACGRTVDLIILNDVPPLFARHVLQDGSTIVGRDSDTLRAFTRTTLSRAADLHPFIMRSRRAMLETLAR